jgi:hypothetical protein
MKALTAKGAKYGFGGLIDLASAEPVAVAKAWASRRRRDGRGGAERAGIAGGHPGGEAEGAHMSRSRPGSV